MIHPIMRQCISWTMCRTKIICSRWTSTQRF